MGQKKNVTQTEIRVGLSLTDLISAIKELSAEDREFFVENLLAATSPEYLRSIEEAREDYRAGRTSSPLEVFGG